MANERKISLSGRSISACPATPGGNWAFTLLRAMCKAGSPLGPRRNVGGTPLEMAVGFSGSI